MRVFMIAIVAASSLSLTACGGTTEKTIVVQPPANTAVVIDKNHPDKPVVVVPQ